MAIKKQEFYEGAALHMLARNGGMKSVEYQAPFFFLNGELLIYLKYSTKGRSPWNFTFTSAEQAILDEASSERRVVLGLVCGSDGIAAVSYEGYLRVAAPKESAVHIACFRKHGEHYQLSGPDGTLDWKVAPSNWLKLLGD